MDKDKPVYIGLDIGKFSLSCSAPGFRPRDFSNDRDGIADMLVFVSQVADPADLFFVMESTSVYSSFTAHTLLDLANTAVSIVPPLCVTSFIRSKIKRTKNDRADAVAIRHFAETCDPPRWLPPARPLQRLRELMLVLDSLGDASDRKSNLLEKLESCVEADAYAVASLRSSIGIEEAECLRIEAQIEHLIAADKILAADSQIMLSIPGVGNKVRTVIMADCYPQLKELSQRKLLTYCGMSPEDNQSGRTRGKTRMNKAGNSRVRTVLYMAAMCTVSKGGIMREYFLKQKARGKPGKSALVHVMRKLLYLIQALVKSGQMFDRDIYLNPA